ncbi:YtpR family tRNA-binding protein [Alkalihalobacillus trypoxylicola]|uniref:tRNA-binding protein n=1 Tax=Alkalihalobacillus trypoxylicola TaxID=519424 RepID=A0A162CUA3_9BACI|nr:DUF4479 family protein [Alkalihalobacillus trypoxylicola]KYG26673.1 tRNA-binding protein [Alkalihalobacillus trypoxylicola]
MNVFYNQEGVGDTLLLYIKDTSFENRAFEKNGDIVRIFDKKTKETVGYNIFSASSYGPFTGNGALELDEPIRATIVNAFEKNNQELEGFSFEEQNLFVVGFVEEKEKHPNADKLSVCQVNIGSSTLQIVCGAPNVDSGQRVVVACVGAVMPSGLKIKEAKLRGVDSSGMICSASELGLPNAPQEKGILVLDENYIVGSPFKA